MSQQRRSNDDNDDAQLFREMRHNPCLMTPVAAVCLFVFVLFSIATMLFKVPILVLGFVLSPFLQNSHWFIEFLYPMGLARWAHLYLVKMNSSKRKDKTHSRTVEQRFEVVQGRVFIHAIPQLLDNVGYLVVCLPPLASSPSSASTNESVEITALANSAANDFPSTQSRSLVAFFVDCGDAESTADQLQDIIKLHYPKYKYSFSLQSLFCTHKHHDHTAGNRGLLDHPRYGRDLKRIHGGAVERVPYCNVPVRDGDMPELPSVPGNDMNDVVELEVIAVPGHTRGSVAYSLKSKVGSSLVSFCFTGDTLFSGGSGVPFESDRQPKSDLNKAGKEATSPIRASAGNNAIERCFAELVIRSMATPTSCKDKLLFFPGHEYSAELLQRQFLPPTNGMGNADAMIWNKFSPSYFFETASQMFVAVHRRNLAKDGKVLAIPTHLDRELKVNPTLRQMFKRGEEIIKALQLWRQNFARGTVHVLSDLSSSTEEGQNGDAATEPPKTPATEDQWTVAVHDVERTVFTTMYTKDLDALISDMSSGRIKPQAAVARLQQLKKALEEPVVGRRPIPGTLPTQKAMYQAILAIALLGSAPSALTVKDSRAMNLPLPVAPHKSDKILVSQRRLISILTALGLIRIDTEHGRDVIKILKLLWQESLEYGDAPSASYGGVEQSFEQDDLLELGTLKWMLYGAETNTSFLGKMCKPCGGGTPEPSRPHPIHSSKKRRTNGELVKHDIVACLLCQDAAGCPGSGRDHNGDTDKQADRNEEQELELAELLPPSADPPPTNGYGKRVSTM